MSPRRLTGKEEFELVEAAQRLDAAQDQVNHLLVERDRLILEISEAGARVTDIASVLAMTRKAVHDAMDRARER